MGPSNHLEDPDGLLSSWRGLDQSSCGVSQQMEARPQAPITLLYYLSERQSYKERKRSSFPKCLLKWPGRSQKPGPLPSGRQEPKGLSPQCCFPGKGCWRPGVLPRCLTRCILTRQQCSPSLSPHALQPGCPPASSTRVSAAQDTPGPLRPPSAASPLPLLSRLSCAHSTQPPAAAQARATTMATEALPLPQLPPSPPAPPDSGHSLLPWS